MKKILIGLTSLLAALGVSTYVTGCGSDSDSTASSQSYAGPGSQWGVTLNGNSTFNITYASTVGGATEMEVDGTYATQSSGFLKLTVTSASGTNAPSAGDQAYALNIPGFAFILKPLGNDSEIIPMISAGTCPTSQQDFNWMVTSHEANGQGSDLTNNRDLLGTASYDGSGTMTLPAKYDLENNSLTAGDTISGTCADGIIDLPSSNATLWLSESGAALVKTVNSGRDGVIVAMPQSTISATSDLDGEYIGIMFNEAIDENSDSETQPVWLTMSGGAATAGAFSDVDAGTKDNSGTVSITFTANTPANGFISGTLTSGSDTAPLTCQVTTGVNGTSQNLMFCVGVDAADHTGGTPGESDQLYTVLLVSQ